MKFLWVLFSVSLFLNLNYNAIFASDLAALEEATPSTQISLFPENARDPRILAMSSSRDPLDPRFEADLMEKLHDKIMFEMLWKFRLKISRTNKSIFWRYANNFFANPKIGDFDFLINLLTPETWCPWPKVLERIVKRRKFSVSYLK